LPRLETYEGYMTDKKLSNSSGLTPSRTIGFRSDSPSGSSPAAVGRENMVLKILE
jgi:hypothetical protein